jgi:hypothetical protein
MPAKKTYVKPPAVTPSVPSGAPPAVDADARVRVGLSLTPEQEKGLEALAFLSGTKGVATYIQEKLVQPHLTANAEEVSKLEKLRGSLK